MSTEITAPAGALDLAQLRSEIKARGSSPAAIGMRQTVATPAHSSAEEYFTVTGSHGLPLAPGRPSGRACQPIRFTVNDKVPNWVYNQIASVVAEARHDGIDVTVENREFYWYPSSLYYVAGQSAATTVRLAIFASNGTPARLANGEPEHINLGWDTRVDPDGRYEDLTTVQGILAMRTLDGDPAAVRRAIRQLIAITQGIGSTDNPASGIADGNTVDDFTPADIAAVKQMSGCTGTGTAR